MVLVALGDVEEALDHLDTAIDLGLGVGYPFRDWPPLDPIRDHPRHRAQLERMDYPDPPIEPLVPEDVVAGLRSGGGVP